MVPPRNLRRVISSDFRFATSDLQGGVGDPLFHLENTTADAVTEPTHEQRTAQTKEHRMDHARFYNR